MRRAAKTVVAALMFATLVDPTPKSRQAHAIDFCSVLEGEGCRDNGCLAEGGVCVSTKSKTRYVCVDIQPSPPPAKTLPAHR